MRKRNGQSNGNKKVMHIKILICNALAVESKCKDLLPIKVEVTIKEKKNKANRYTHNFHPKNHS